MQASYAACPSICGLGFGRAEVTLVSAQVVMTATIRDRRVGIMVVVVVEVLEGMGMGMLM